MNKTKLLIVLVAFFAIWLIFVWIGRRAPMQEQANAAKSADAELATATGAELGGLQDKTNSDAHCITEGSPGAAAAALRLQFSFMLDKNLKAEGYDLDVRIVDCTFDRLYVTGADATGENLRPRLLQNGGKESLQKLGFKQLTWGSSTWNQTARVILD